MKQELGSPLLPPAGLAHMGEQSKKKRKHMPGSRPRGRGCGGRFSKHHAEGAAWLQEGMLP